MLKKTIKFLIIIAFFGTLVYGYYFIKKINTPVQTAINAVPVNSAIIIEINNLRNIFDEINENNQIWNELKHLPKIFEIDNNLTYFDSIISNNEKAHDILKNKQVIISGHLLGKQKIEYLYLISLKNIYEETLFKKLISGLIPKNANLSKRQYNKVSIYKAEIQKGKNRIEFYYAFSKGVFITAYSSILIEEAIRQLDIKNSLMLKENFINVSKTAGKNVFGNIYINFKSFQKFISIILNDNYKNYISSYTNFADWMELDVNLKKDAVLLNGFSSFNEHDYLNVFIQQEPQKIDFYKLLPLNTSTFIALGINNYLAYCENYNQFLKKSNKLKYHKSEKQKIKQKFNIDIQEWFNLFFENEVALVYTNDINQELGQNSYVIINTKSKSLAKKGLLKLVKTNNKQQVYNYKIDEETIFLINKFPVNNLPEILFGNLFSNFESDYYTFIDNYIVFGNSIASLKKIIKANVLKTTLINDINYKEFTDFLSSKSNFFFFTNIPLSVELYQVYSNKKLNEIINESTDVFQKFYALGFQFSSSKSMIYNNLFLKYNPVYKEQSKTIWESKLDTSIIFKPKFVVNHYTKEKEIFLQDLNNNIYLINNSGRIIWKKNIYEKIISDVFQVDYYKNGKLQILFNTKSKIYLFDRNGNYVERYPIKLQSPAVNGISLFDYEKNKDYRIFVACKNKKVYAYDIKGKTISGWKFNSAERNIISKIQHFVANNKDYIVFSDEMNTYFLDRRGNSRFSLNKNFSKSINNDFVFEKKTSRSDSRLVTTSNSGTIYYIYFNGKVEETKIADYNTGHYFDYKDVDRDGSKDYIFIDNNELQVINKKNKLLMSYKFENTLKCEPVYFLFPDNSGKIGVTDELNNHIFLFNDNGTLFKEFPLEGNTLFSIGKLKIKQDYFNLIVGNKDGYLLNYKINLD
ncbi:MAG: hypothetical protein KAT68_05970 [Bacteroidales bacterium]|nr:hypothetical protein [Bacteroidales bacterium]